MKATAGPAAQTRFSSLYEELFYKALRIRMVEQRVMELYPSDKIQSPVHLSIGQEQVAVGVCHDLRTSDPLFGSYRSHAFYLAKGGALREMVAELYGKVTGCGRGKAGSMHLAAPDVGFMGSSAVVASTIPHAVGAALAAKRRKTGQVIAAVFGDGATEEGVYHESLNFAALHELPVVLVCENNGLAVHSRLKARESYSILDQPQLYGIPVQQITDGWDLLKIQAVMSRLIQQVRQEGTPRFVEIQTCRYMEHVGVNEDFAAGYRSEAEVERWKGKDPLLVDRPLIQKFATAIGEEIDDAVEFAESSPWPSQEELIAHVE